MIVAVRDPQSCWEAFQAVLRLKRAHKRLNRQVIQALIRERLELCIEQLGEVWHDPTRLEEGRAQVSEWLHEQLLSFEIELEAFDLRELPRSSPQRDRPELRPRYDEFWLEKIVTADGFELELDLVVRTWVPELLAGAGGMNWLAGAFTRAAEEFFGPLDSEAGLSEVARFQLHLAPLQGLLQDNLGMAWNLLTAHRHGGVLGRNPRISCDATWVTRRSVSAQKAAFQPGRQIRYLDAYHLFALMENWQNLPDRYRMSSG